MVESKRANHDEFTKIEILQVDWIYIVLLHGIFCVG